MTIYHVYFEGFKKGSKTSEAMINNGHTKAMIRHLGRDQQAYLARLIKETKDNSYVFIHTIAQEDAFDEFVKKYELADHISFKMDRPITNGNYLNEGRKLWLTVFKN